MGYFNTCQMKYSLNPSYQYYKYWNDLLNYVQSKSSSSDSIVSIVILMFNYLQVKYKHRKPLIYVFGKFKNSIKSNVENFVNYFNNHNSIKSFNGDPKDFFPKIISVHPTNISHDEQKDYYDSYKDIYNILSDDAKKYIFPEKSPSDSVTI